MTDTDNESRPRFAPEIRYEQVLQAAVELAREIGYQQLTRNKIADFAGVSPALVSHYLGSMVETVDKVIEAAISGKVLEIIAQGLTYQNELIMNAPRELREQAAAYIGGIACGQR
jgi:AcrR family transcriptional regulator